VQQYLATKPNCCQLSLQFTANREFRLAVRLSFDDQFSHPDSKVGTMETFSVAFVALVTLCSASSGEFIFLNFPILKKNFR